MILMMTMQMGWTAQKTTKPTQLLQLTALLVVVAETAAQHTVLAVVGTKQQPPSWTGTDQALILVGSVP
jgi:hypothetical protein